MSAVKSLRRARRLGAVLMLLLTAPLPACATHLIGLVTPTERGTTLTEIDGTRYRLVLGPDSAPMAWLDGHLAEVDGQLVFRRVHVTDWKVPEGLHGMPAWVGALEEVGVQVGMHDRNSGAYYLFDEDASELLHPFLGLPVLIEGYVEGAHRVRVVYFRVLAAEE